MPSSVIGSAVASVAGSVISSKIAGGASKKASGAQQAGADASLQLQADMYNQSREDLAPYRQTGNLANNRLAYLMGLTPQYDRNQISTELGFGGGTAPSGGSGSGSYDPSAPPVMVESVNGDQITLSNGQTVSRAEFNARLQAPDVAPHIPAGFQPAPGVDVSRLYQQSAVSPQDNAAIDAEIARRQQGYEPYDPSSGTRDVRVTGVNPDGSYTLSDGRKISAQEFLSRLRAPDVKAMVDQNWRPTAGSDVSRLFGVQQIDSTPTNVSGSAGFGDLSKYFTLDDYVEDPGYQFRLGEGNKAIDRTQAARGGFYSGAALKEANRYNSGMASQEYGSAYGRFNNDRNTLYNRLSGISNQGMGATNQGVYANQNNANAQGSIFAAQGQNQANSAIQQGNILNQGLSGILGGGGSSFGNAVNYAGNSFYNPGTFNVGAASSGLPWSDERLKENISLVGNESGHNVYKFTYKDDPDKTPYIGVMAQEVRLTHPEAVKDSDGYLSVDYDAIGVKFREAV